MSNAEMGVLLVIGLVAAAALTLLWAVVRNDHDDDYWNGHV